jgi:hypothetical protein
MDWCIFERANPILHGADKWFNASVYLSRIVV